MPADDNCPPAQAEIYQDLGEDPSAVSTTVDSTVQHSPQAPVCSAGSCKQAADWTIWLRSSSSGADRAHRPSIHRQLRPEWPTVAQRWQVKHAICIALCDQRPMRVIMCHRCSDETIRIWDCGRFTTEPGVDCCTSVMSVDRCVRHQSCHPAFACKDARSCVARHPQKCWFTKASLAVPWVVLHSGSHDESVYEATFSPDGTLATSAHCDRAVRIWELHYATSGEDGQMHISETAAVVAVCTSPCGEYTAAAAGRSVSLITSRLREIDLPGDVLTPPRSMTRLDHFAPTHPPPPPTTNALDYVHSHLDSALPVPRAMIAHEGARLTVAVGMLLLHRWSGEGEDGVVDEQVRVGRMEHIAEATAVVFSMCMKMCFTGSSDGIVRMFLIDETIARASATTSASDSKPASLLPHRVYSDRFEEVLGKARRKREDIGEDDSGAETAVVENSYGGAGQSQGQSLAEPTGGSQGQGPWSQGGVSRRSAKNSVSTAAIDAIKACTAVAVDPSRNIVAGGFVDWEVRVWDVDSSILKAVLSGHTHPVRSICFISLGSSSGDGHAGADELVSAGSDLRLLSAGDDAQLLIWHLDPLLQPGRPVEPCRKQVLARLTADELVGRSKSIGFGIQKVDKKRVAAAIGFGIGAVAASSDGAWAAGGGTDGG